MEEKKKKSWLEQVNQPVYVDLEKLEKYVNDPKTKRKTTQWNVFFTLMEVELAKGPVVTSERYNEIWEEAFGADE